MNHYQVGDVVSVVNPQKFKSISFSSPLECCWRLDEAIPEENPPWPGYTLWLATNMRDDYQIKAWFGDSKDKYFIVRNKTHYEIGDYFEHNFFDGAASADWFGPFQVDCIDRQNRLVDSTNQVRVPMEFCRHSAPVKSVSIKPPKSSDDAQKLVKEFNDLVNLYRDNIVKRCIELTCVFCHLGWPRKGKHEHFFPNEKNKSCPCYAGNIIQEFFPEKKPKE